MAKPHVDWTVLPHGKLKRLEHNLLSVSGTMNMPPMGAVTRRMTIVRLADRRLIIYSAISLDEKEMEALLSYGTPAYLIVPGDIHRMDAKPWKDRFPAMKVIAPAGAREKIEDVVPVDATEVDFGDPSVRYMTMPGTANKEAVLVVETASGTTIVLNDLIFDLANRPGFSGWLFKALGMTGDKPHIVLPVKLRQVELRPVRPVPSLPCASSGRSCSAFICSTPSSSTWPTSSSLDWSSPLPGCCARPRSPSHDHHCLHCQ